MVRRRPRELGLRRGAPPPAGAARAPRRPGHARAPPPAGAARARPARAPPSGAPPPGRPAWRSLGETARGGCRGGVGEAAAGEAPGERRSWPGERELRPWDLRRRRGVPRGEAVAGEDKAGTKKKEKKKRRKRRMTRQLDKL
ncbi:hypothetical protein SEVIR_9G495350v4 [Setaria viridis]